MEHRALQETKSKLKKLLDHQIDLEQLLNNVTQSTVTKEQYLSMARNMSVSFTQETAQQSKNAWRSLITNQCKEEIIGITNALYAGQSDQKRTLKIMSRAGMGGSAKVEHIETKLVKELVQSTVAFEVGGKVGAQYVIKDGIMYLTTPNRMYMLRYDFPMGGLIGLKESRVIQ